MEVNQDNNKLVVKNIFKGIGISMLFSCICLLVYSLILSYTNISETTIPPVIIIITAISILIGSSIGNINLSLSLMALPRHLTEYVIMHELCHTRFMSHDDNFYRLLDKCADGESERMKAELRRYTTWIKGNSDNSLE